MICAACRLTREPGSLIAFWPVGDPDRRRYVCRPTTPAGMGMPVGGPCFGQVVGPVFVHAIALAAAPAVPLRLLEPIRPETPAWFGLMREAGIRVAA